MAKSGVARPDPDGRRHAAPRRLRRHAADPGRGEAGVHVPIIMLTSEADVEQRVQGLRAGADDDIVKPFHPLELIARSRRSWRGAAAAGSRRAAASTTALGQLVPLLRREGRGRHDHHRHQHRHRPRAGAEAPHGADRRQPPVRRPARLHGPRARHRLDRQRGQRGRPRRRPAQRLMVNHRLRDRPAARAALAGAVPTSWSSASATTRRR